MSRLAISRKVATIAMSVVALGGIGAGVATAATMSTGARAPQVSRQIDTPEPGDTPDQQPGQVDTPEPGDHADQHQGIDTPEPGDTPDRPGAHG